MKSMPSAEEQRRLQDVRQYNIIDTGPEPEFDDFTELASNICDTPIAVITILDKNRQWFKSRLGLEMSEAPRALGFCGLTIASKDLLIIEDVHADPRFAANPLVRDNPKVRFYAGAPMISPRGHVIGTLAVIDHRPRKLAEDQQESLRKLARHVVILLELRKTITTLKSAILQRARAETELRQIQAELERRVEDRNATLTQTNATLQSEVMQRMNEKNFSDALINSMPGIFYLFDETGNFLRWNDNFMRVTGFSNEETARAHPLDFFDTAEEKQLIAARIEEAFATGYSQSEVPLLTKSGRKIPFLFNALRVKIDNRVCLSGMGIDITERKAFEESLKEAEERYRQLVELSPDAIFVMKGIQCVFANQSGLKLIGASSEEQLREKTILDLIHPESRQDVMQRYEWVEQHGQRITNVEERFVRFDGHIIDVELAIAPFMDKGELARLVVARDISDAKRQKEQLERQANYDDLTQLANRYLLNDRIRQAMAHADRTESMVIVAFIDLDNFKLINDTLGHDIGDQLLVQVAERLVKCVRGGDTVARYGGDEFVLVLYDHRGDDAISAWIGRMVQQISHPYTVDEHQLYVTCSVGLSLYPRDGRDAQTLLKHADAAMYEAKANGRDQFQFFIPTMNERVRERFTMESKLRRALERREFILYYQPQLDLSSGEVIGAEALIRWMSPELGLQSPLKFIPVAEETGLIVPIGKWVLEQACRHNKELHDLGFSGLTVSVNLSPRQFAPKILVESVEAALGESGLAPDWLKLEVTEGMVMNHPEQAKYILRELKDMGVHLAIDDFGVGYSSLSYLQRFPMDQLKIDQSFVQGVAQDPNDAAITQAVISLGRALRLKVVAEGVSTKEQLLFLQRHACDEIQGNYFCEALPFDELRGFLENHRCESTGRHRYPN